MFEYFLDLKSPSDVIYSRGLVPKWKILVEEWRTDGHAVQAPHTIRVDGGWLPGGKGPTGKRPPRRRAKSNNIDSARCPSWDRQRTHSYRIDGYQQESHTPGKRVAFETDSTRVEVLGTIAVNVDSSSNDPLELHPIDNGLPIPVGLGRELLWRQSG